MRTTRRSLANTLRAEAHREVPAPNAGFVAALEQRLFGATATPSVTADVLPLRRRVSRGVAIGVVAAVVSGAGAAAVAIVRSTHTDPPATTITPSPTTAPATTAPATTAPPVTVPALTVPPSTEVQYPATMDLACSAAGGAVTCAWSSGPDGTDHYALLRSTPNETRGRALFPAPGDTSFVDTTATAGLPYTYLVHALDATGQSLAHSTFAQVTCCG